MVNRGYLSYESGLKLQITVMVSTAVTKIGLTELIFVDPGMKVIGQYYHDVLLSQQMLPAIRQAIHLSFNKTTLHPTVPRTPLKCHSKKHWISLV